MSPVWYYAIFLFIGAYLMIIMGSAVLARRVSVLSGFFLLFCLATGLYALGYGMEVTRTDPFALRFWSRFEYIGIPFISSFLLIFVAFFVDSTSRIARIISLPLILISTLFVIIRQTNHMHYQFYQNLSYENFSNFTIMTFDKGPWYWALGIFNFVCIVVSIGLMFRFYRQVSKTRKRQALWILIGTTVPLFPYVAYILGIIPYGIDTTPAFLVIASFFYYIAVFRHDVFSLVPIGRDRLVETMTEAVLVLNAVDQVADVNPAARTAFGDKTQNPVGHTLDTAFPMLVGLGSEPTKVKHNNRVWELTRITVEERGRSANGFLIVGHDVTEQEILVARLERMAHEDALTGLLNRHSWDQAVTTELARLSRHGRFGSIIYLDLDGFKNVNDTHGHMAGDSVLKAVARVLKEGLRSPDLVGRYGGEEFVLFLPEIHPEAAVDVAERLRVDLYEAVEADMNVDVKVTGSFGVAGGIVSDDTSLESFVESADKAMYESKRTGKNRVSWNRY